MKRKPCMEEIRNGYFCFGDRITVNANSCLNKEIIKEIWNGFCYSASVLEITSTDECIFKIGNVTIPELAGYSYAIEVSSEGVAIVATDEQNLMYGLFALLEYIEPISLEIGKEQLQIPCLSIKDKAAVDNRMIHLCVFPETSAEFLQRFIKMCGVLKYNYLIIEFWGMLRFECLKELAWNHAFTKEQVQSLVKLANNLGIEVIPMFNHWGHASASRVSVGKHVVLDQNPRLQTLFNATGWVWSIEKPEVRELMKNIRKEMIELCGDGKYFHIGCDEAYDYENMSSQDIDILLEYIKEISDDLASYGRRPIMWGDMLLYNRYDSGNLYACSCVDEQMEQQLLTGLDRRIVIADWQYEARKYPVETSLLFKEQGFDVLCCPWDRAQENIQACTETVKKHNLFGIMHTTWHTIQQPRGMIYVWYDAVLSWNNDLVDGEHMTLETAALLRKVDFVNGDYEGAGFVPRQIRVDIPETYELIEQ